jgi:pilus assembly protein CpaD
MLQVIRSRRAISVLSCASVISASFALAACNRTDQVITGSIPTDYRDRHPIRLTEAEHAIQLLIGSGNRRPDGRPARTSLDDGKHVAC